MFIRITAVFFLVEGKEKRRTAYDPPENNGHLLFLKLAWPIISVRNTNKVAETLGLTVDITEVSWKKVERLIKNSNNDLSPNQGVNTRAGEGPKKAREQNIQPVSVEEKVMDFALKCEYYQYFNFNKLTLPSLSPSQSLIVDLGDSNWLEVFSEEELQELREVGGDIDYSVPEELEQCFQEIMKLQRAIFLIMPKVFLLLILLKKDSKRGYLPNEQILPDRFSKPVHSNPPLFAQIGYGPRSVQKAGEVRRGFCNSPSEGVQSAKSEGVAKIERFDYSDSVVRGTEGTSKANTDALNNVHQLSSVKPIANRKMGRRGDTIFEAGKLELGCIEIGAAKDQTKEMYDSLLKMPTVLRDMLLSATFSPSILHEAHIMGYSISGGSVSLLDVDIPKGFVTRMKKDRTFKCFTDLSCVEGETLDTNSYWLAIINTYNNVSTYK
ncbi:hypothetical protein BDC45DRAFT_537672 [Circinella umbellata]|nr:hypothetical protein BDC45DRAFT_537672 [Circinella umbellata]